MDSEDGELFIKQLAHFVRTHEKALANALQFKRQNLPRHGSSQSVSSISTAALTATPIVPERPATSSSTSNSLAAALSLGTLNFTSHSVKSTKLALTPHHLFYLLSRFEELSIPVGPMKVRLENLHDTSTSANYVSFLSQSQRPKTHGSEVGSVRSVSSIRSVMSGMSALWASFGLGSSISAAREERQKAALQADMKYLYSAFTKIPCLRLAPDWRARLIRGYEEFPFDSAVPLYVFKNVQALEICDIDFRQFFGWDRLADQLRSLTVKRASLDDPADILIDIVLDDMDKRRRRSSKTQASPTVPWGGSASPRRGSTVYHADLPKPPSAPGSPEPRNSHGDINVGSLTSDHSGDNDVATSANSRRPSLARADSDIRPGSPAKLSTRPRSHSPRRPSSSRNCSSYVRGSHKVRRSGSGSSHSSLSDSWHNTRGSSSNLLAMGILPASKWRFLKHLGLADNSLTLLPATSLSPLANTLGSLDLSSNLFTQIPDSLATLTALRALNLAYCMIDSLHSLTRNPLPAISAMNLRGNRLQSVAGIERLKPLERLDLRENRLIDPLELARLTGMPEIREIWVEGNPFTRTHKNYRITIFNLFRNTPGYSEDILIDATGPTYNEKKYLIERVPIPPAVPVIKPPVPVLPVDVVKPAIIYDTPREAMVLKKDRPLPKATASEIHTSNSRRRRASKRRIVDLATNATTTRIVDHPAATASNTAVNEDNYRISHSPSMPRLPTEAPVGGLLPSPTTDVPRVESGVLTQLPPSYKEAQSKWEKSQPDWDAEGELYRRKIETLRDQVGNSYLSVLNEETWDPSRHPPRYSDPDFSSPTSPINSNPASPLPTASAQVVHSGRMLG